MKFRGILTVFLLFLLIFEANWLFSPKEFLARVQKERDEQPELQVLQAIPPDDWSAQTAFWKKEFQENTTEPIKIYDRYIRFYQQYNEENQHTAAHMIGGVLYEQYGKEGLSFCDSTYAFGCFHEFFTRAVGEYGIEVVAELDKACIARWGEKGLGCQHGIGHALLAALGDDQMAESLAVCSTLNWQGPIGGCTSGVFMEHNFGTVRSQKGFELRRFNTKKPLSPCDEVSSEFRQACYFEQPSWWWLVLQKDVVKVGKLCDLVQQEPFSQACFWGVGHMLANGTQFQVPRAMELCEKLGSQKKQDWCKEGNAWGFFADRQHRGKASEVCTYLPPGEQRQRCEKQVSILPNNPWIIGEE